MSLGKKFSAGLAHLQLAVKMILNDSGLKKLSVPNMDALFKTGNLFRYRPRPQQVNQRKARKLARQLR